MGPSGPDLVSGPQVPSQEFIWNFAILLDSYHSCGENEVLFIKIGARVLDLWPDMSFRSRWLKRSQGPRPQGPKVNIFLKILWFYWIHCVILEKMRSCSWKLKLRLWTYGLICLLSDPNVVSRTQTPRSRNFWDFIILLDSSHDSWENQVLFVKIRTRVLD